MAEDRKARILALANALIIARGKGDVVGAINAMDDAEHILYPKAADPIFKEWQAAHGIIPTTPEEDARHKRARDDRRDKSIRNLA